MKAISHYISRGLLTGAFAALAMLLLVDSYHQLRPTEVHRLAGAWSFVLIGASSIALQLTAAKFKSAQAKQALLGLGFVLWGTAQIVPPGTAAVAMDCTVTLIFVLDLGWGILGELRRGERQSA